VNVDVVLKHITIFFYIAQKFGGILKIWIYYESLLYLLANTILYDYNIPKLGKNGINCPFNKI